MDIYIIDRIWANNEGIMIYKLLMDYWKINNEN